MALNEKLLGQDEYVIYHLRQHWKKLVGPILIFFLLGGLVGVGLALVPANMNPYASWAIVGIALIAAIIWVLTPVIKWATTTYTLTNRRIITRTGVITRTGHDLPVKRVTDVTYNRGILDRILGCGTLNLQTSAEDPVVLPDLPNIEEVHVRVTDVLFSEDDEPHGES